MKVVCVEIEPTFEYGCFTLYRVYDAEPFNDGRDPPYVIVDDDGDGWEAERYSGGEYGLFPEYGVYFIEVDGESDMR